MTDEDESKEGIVTNDELRAGEGEGEGEGALQHHPHPVLDNQLNSFQSHPFSLQPVPLNSGLASMASSVAPLLQSPTLLACLSHLSSSLPLPSSASHPTHRHPALLTAPFNSYTHDASVDDVLIEEIERHVRTMKPILRSHTHTRTHHAHRPTSPRQRRVNRASTHHAQHTNTDDDDDEDEGNESDDDGTETDEAESFSSDDDDFPFMASSLPPTSHLINGSQSRRASQFIRDVSSSSVVSPPSHTHSSAGSLSTRSRVRRCFDHYTPLVLQTLPFIKRYGEVIHKIQAFKLSGVQQYAERGEDERKEGCVEGDERLTKIGTARSPGSSSMLTSGLDSLSHPIPALPTLQQQLSAAVTNRLSATSSSLGPTSTPSLPSRPLASSSSSSSTSSMSPAIFSRALRSVLSSSDRSFTSLVVHEPQATLNHLLHLLGLQGLKPSKDEGVDGVSEAMHNKDGASNVVSVAPRSSPSSAPRVVPSLLLVNEESKIRKDFMQQCRDVESAAGSSIDSSSSSRPVAPLTNTSIAQLSRLDSLPYFETLCRLLDVKQPHLLVPCVRVHDEIFGVATNAINADACYDKPPVPSSYNAAAQPSRSHKPMLLSTLERETHAERALRILPPLFHSSRAHQPSSEVDETDETDDTDDPSASASSPAPALLSASPDPLFAARVSARCSLLIMAGRPVDAVLLRLRMAREARECNELAVAEAEEDHAIRLAASIVQKAEVEEAKEVKQGRIDDPTMHPDLIREASKMGEQLQPLSTTDALRAECFHHLYSHWLQHQFATSSLQRQDALRQLRSAMSASMNAGGSNADSASNSGTAAALPLNRVPPSTCQLDPRIDALLSTQSNAAIFMHIVGSQKTRYDQMQQQHHQQQQAQQLEASASTATNGPSQVPSTRPPPRVSPWLLPSVSDVQRAQAQSGSGSDEVSESESVSTDLPMGCILQQLNKLA